MRGEKKAREEERKPNEQATEILPINKGRVEVKEVNDWGNPPGGEETEEEPARERLERREKRQNDRLIRESRCHLPGPLL